MNKETHVPEWMLERYLLDELPRKKRRQLEKELEQDPALRAKLENLRIADRQILSTYPYEQMIPEIMKKAALTKREPAAPRRWRLAWIAAPALALVVFLLVILPPIIRQRLAISENSQPADYIGAKGSAPLSLSTPGLQLYRRSGGIDEILRNGETAAAGDLLQLAYIPGEETHGVIVSFDGWGSVTLHFPDHVQGDTALKKGRKIFLATAYKLDNAPRFERFLFITAKEKILASAILEKAMRLAADPGNAIAGKLNLPERFRQFSLLIRK